MFEPVTMTMVEVGGVYTVANVQVSWVGPGNSTYEIWGEPRNHHTGDPLPRHLSLIPPVVSNGANAMVAPLRLRAGREALWVPHFTNGIVVALPMKVRGVTPIVDLIISLAR